MRFLRKLGYVMSMSITPTTPGEALRALRNSAGMTLEEVAASAGVSATHLSRVENGVRKATPAWIGAVTEAIAAKLKAAA